MSLPSSSQSVVSSSSHSLLTFLPILFTVIPQHIFISLICCFGYTAILRTFHSHIWWDALPFCYEPHWLNSTFIFLGVYTYLNLWRFTVFSTDGVKNLSPCILDFSVVSSNQSEFVAVFMFFNFLIGPGFIFESYSITFYFSIAIFLLLLLD